MFVDIHKIYDYSKSEGISMYVNQFFFLGKIILLGKKHLYVHKECTLRKERLQQS